MTVPTANIVSSDMITRSCLIGLIIVQYTAMPMTNITGMVISRPEERIDSQVGIQRVAQVSAQHHENSLSEVDDIHDAEHERQAAGHQRVESSDQDSINDGLENQHRNAP